jgi:hypothetical protein
MECGRHARTQERHKQQRQIATSNTHRSQIQTHLQKKENALAKIAESSERKLVY